MAKSCGQYLLTTTFEEIESSEASLRGETESERVKKLVKNSRRTSNRLPSSQLDAARDMRPQQSESRCRVRDTT